MARKKRRLRQKGPRISKSASAAADARKAALEGRELASDERIREMLEPPSAAPPSAVDLLRADQPNPPVIVH